MMTFTTFVRNRFLSGGKKNARAEYTRFAYINNNFRPYFIRGGKKKKTKGSDNESSETSSEFLFF